MRERVARPCLKAYLASASVGSATPTSTPGDGPRLEVKCWADIVRNFEGGGKEAEDPVDKLAEGMDKVGPGGHCSPCHRMSFTSINEGP